MQNKTEKQKNLEQFQKIIIDHSDKIYCPEGKLNYKKLKTNSCFDIQEHSFKNKSKLDNIEIKTDKLEIPKNICKIVDMIVSEEQHLILQNWFNSNIAMYNETLKFMRENISITDIIMYKKTKLNIYHNKNNQKKINDTNKNLLLNFKKLQKKKNKTKKDNSDIKKYKSQIKTNEKQLKVYIKDIKILHKQEIKDDKKMKEIDKFINWKNLRTNHLKNIRDEIVIKSNEEEYNRIKVHILDCAIKQACTSYKSCITNFKRGNIKRFTIRNWRYNKKRKILEIENSYVTKKDDEFHICPSIFKKMEYRYKSNSNNEKYELKKESCKILYDSEINKYKLLVNKTVTEEKYDNNNKSIFMACDQGIRTFATNLTVNKVSKIGSTVGDKIKKQLVKIDKINKKNISKRIKEKVNKKCNKKIKNMVDELHWKTINYMTENAQNIIIGKFSMKDVSSNKTSKLSNMIKRIGLSMSPYKFRERLKYKCSVRGIGYKEQHEGFTTAVCNRCSEYNDKVGSNIMFECVKCKIVQERDPHGACGIALRGIFE